MKIGITGWEQYYNILCVVRVAKTLLLYPKGKENLDRRVQYVR